MKQSEADKRLQLPPQPAPNRELKVAWFANWLMELFGVGPMRTSK